MEVKEDSGDLEEDFKMVIPILWSAVNRESSRISKDYRSVLMSEKGIGKKSSPDDILIFGDGVPIKRKDYEKKFRRKSR